MPLGVSCANDWRVWDLTKPAARPAARAPRARTPESSARWFYTYGLVTWPTPKFGPASASSELPRVISVTNPAPNPFAARVKTDPSDAVYVPAIAAALAPIEIAAAALLAGLICGFCELIARLTAAPTSPAFSADLRAAAFFSDDLGFCGASCGGGVCGDEVCPRGEIVSSRLLGNRRKRSIFLFFFSLFSSFVPPERPHIFFWSDGENAPFEILEAEP